MKLVIIFGPPAVGKMTVGQALAKLTDFKLFHNHMSIKLVRHFFDFGMKEFRRLDKLIRFAIFNVVAKSDLEGLIFTIVWAHNLQEDEDYMNEIEAIFLKEKATIHYVELKADLPKRLERNKHENRLAHKPSKRDIEMSEKNLLKTEDRYRMNTHENEYPDKEILTIDNTHLTPEEVAQKIKDHYNL